MDKRILAYLVGLWSDIRAIQDEHPIMRHWPVIVCESRDCDKLASGEQN